MQGKIVTIPTAEIHDWDSFHAVFARVMGFPDFYGANMNAWIDCMTSVDQVDHGMSAITVGSGELLILSLEEAPDFRSRCPEQYEALLECTAFVNYRRTERRRNAVLALLLSGWFNRP
jgi:hypothetical protein